MVCVERQQKSGWFNKQRAGDFFIYVLVNQYSGSVSEWQKVAAKLSRTAASTTTVIKVINPICFKYAGE